MIAILNDGLLRCPRCGGECLHHDEIITYSRQEDAEETLVTWTSLQGTTVETVKSADADNPSPRRHGLSILFKCEDCERPSWLDGYHQN
jgi:hypothetical protein